MSELQEKVCPVCGIKYAAPYEYFKHHSENGSTWKCPNDHEITFALENKMEKLQKEVEYQKQSSSDAWKCYEDQCNHSIALTRKITALKGAITKYRKKIKELK